jgi:cysteine sulfinate desulfinase/cysteine desulfurase-like protein
VPPPLRGWELQERERSARQLRERIQGALGLDDEEYVMTSVDTEESRLALLLRKSRDEVRAMDPIDREQVLTVHRIDQELEAERLRRAHGASPNGWPKTYVVD